MNFTDVDDKTIKASNDGRRAAARIHRPLHRRVSRRRGLAGTRAVEESPRATDEANLRAMVDMINALEPAGPHLRVRRIDLLQDFDAARIRQARAARSQDGMQAGARVDSDEYGKQDARDFVLWKATKPGEPTWDYGCGPGRPGWHIECSAMALGILGQPPIDIHGGGVDLIFPHHENEIAQAEGATGSRSSRFWVHVEFLNIDHEKMSKSIGNVFTVRDILDKGYRASSSALPADLGALPQAAHVLWDILAQAEAAVTRAGRLPIARRCHSRRCGASRHRGRGGSRARGIPGAYRQRSERAGAQGVLFELVRDLNAAMDQGQVGEPTRSSSAKRSIGSTRCSECWRCVARKMRRRPCPAERSTR
jgi:cysteinyl-tRNA synthetase